MATKKETQDVELGKIIDQEDTSAVSEAQDTEELARKEARTERKNLRKTVKRRKSKKEKENPLTSAIRLAVETGKVEFGTKNALSEARQGKAKVFIVASTAPQETKDRLHSYAKLSKTPLIVFEGNPMELGSVCGKPFSVAVLTVYDQGNADLSSISS